MNTRLYTCGLHKTLQSLYKTVSQSSTRKEINKNYLKQYKSEKMEDKYFVEKTASLKSSLVQFSCDTTFHGLRYIAVSNSFGRRLMWIITVVACICAVGYQIIDRVTHYYAWPVNVNVQINYNQSLLFPAVTICNQNAFKATEAVKYGYYELIEEMFSKSANFSVDTVRHYGASNVTLEELYLKLGHDKHDLIVKCAWNNFECGPENFKPILTDHGLCYMFNENTTSMTVSSSGVETGLRLTLNVEQYEYMTGPHDAAGLKMLLHDSRELPSVHGLGEAVATGTHSFVGVRYMLVNNLPYPHGNCDDKLLSHTDFYTTEACRMDCITTLAVETCGCRNMYMPGVYDSGHSHVCTLEEYVTCLKDFEDEFHKNLGQKCRCPIPCEFSVVDPSFSYATISNHVVRKLLTSKDSLSLKSKLLQASETTSKMDRTKLEDFKILVKAVKGTFEKLKTLVNRTSMQVANQSKEIIYIQNEVRSAYWEKERLYRFQQYAIERNFLRGREAMEERTLRNVVVGFAEFAMLNARRIRRLAAMPATDVSGRQDLYETTIDALKVRQELAGLAKGNITELYNAFSNGTRIFNYKFEDISLKHNDYITPKPLLNYSMHHNFYMNEFAPKIFRGLDLMHNVLDMFMNEATEAFLNLTVNETSLNYTFEQYLLSCRLFMFSKSVVYSQGLERPVTVIKERYDKFEKLWEELESFAEKIKQNLDSLNLSLNKLKIIVSTDLNILVEKALHYVISRNESLLQLADEFQSNNTQGIVSFIKDFFQEIETRGQAVFDAWTIMMGPIVAFWTPIIDDEDMKEYYEFTNNSRFLQNLTDVINQSISQYRAARDDLDVRGSIENEDSEFMIAFDELSTHLDAFRDSIKIDSTFVRENFLQLNIFFRQLSYEHITQQSAYDIFALICDIGGSMGLFIGASMLTVIEIIDLFLTQAPLFALGCRRKQKQETLK